MTGIYNHGSSIDQEDMSDSISTTNFFDTYDGSAGNHGYTNNVFPLINLDVLTVTYYDNYDFKSLWVGDYDYVNDGLTATVVNGTYNQPATEFLRVTGQVTGSKTKVLGTTTYINSVSYYDDRYRVADYKVGNGF